MENPEKPIIDKENSQVLGLLFFVIIACPIILVVLLANDIPIPSIRIIFWLSTITALAILYFINLMTLLLHIILKKQTFDRMSELKKFDVVNLCFSFVEVVKIRNFDRTFETKLFITGLAIYLVVIRFLIFITWNK